MDRQEPPKTPPVSPKPPTWTAPPPLQISPQMPWNGQPPVPPPKKDKEFNFGKNLLGILASLLVFIGILLTAWASGSRWIQLCGILAAGLFLMLLGIPDVFSVRFRLRCGNPVSGHHAGLLVL